MIESNDVAAVGIAWGIAAVAPLATIAAIAFAAVTLVTGFFAPIPLFVLPVMALAIPAIVLIAHFHAQHKERERLENPHSYAHMDWDNFYGGLNDYQIENLKKMSNSPEDRAAWFSNSDRNIIGFTYMPLLAIASLGTMVTLSSVSSYLPAVLFSPLLSTIIPVAFSVVIAAGVGASLIYLAVNHNKQVDNKYKLDFSPDIEVPGTPQQEQTVDPSYSWTLGKHRENQASVKQDIVNDDSPKPDYSIVNVLKSVGGSPLHQHDKTNEITDTKDAGLSLPMS